MSKRRFQIDPCYIIMMLTIFVPIVAEVICRALRRMLEFALAWETFRPSA